MGRITDDMTRLRGEVDALRDARQQFMRDLSAGANNRRQEVARMRALFHEAYDTQAKQDQMERQMFVSEISQRAMQLCKDVAADLQGARCTWLSWNKPVENSSVRTPALGSKNFHAPSVRPEPVTRPFPQEGLG
jgi:ribosomal protein L20